MTKKAINNTIENFKKLSIQVSLNGLSFCIWDTISNSMLASETVDFESEATPHSLLKELKKTFTTYKIDQHTYSDIVVIHRNNLFSLVPKPFFKEEEMVNYLKFNTKIIANDVLAYDELENLDIVNVYVPFMNINNYIYDLFGEFTYKHSGTVMITSLLNNHFNTISPTCYVHVTSSQMEITIFNSKKLLLYNSFEYHTTEDFIYYILFTFEQLKLGNETTTLNLFGAVTQNDELFKTCFKYIKNTILFTPEVKDEIETIDFTVLSSL